MKLLKEQGHTVYDCTCNNRAIQSDVLNKIIEKCNAHTVDIDILIHFNMGINDIKGDEKTTGVEVLLYSTTSKAKEVKQKILKNILELGFRNREIKYKTDLAVWRRTKFLGKLFQYMVVACKKEIKILVL